MSGSAPQTREALFDFHMQVAMKDLDGYYATRWDLAMPVTVRAENRAAAYLKTWAVMGKCRSGFKWTARIGRIVEAS